MTYCTEIELKTSFEVFLGFFFLNFFFFANKIKTSSQNSVLSLKMIITLSLAQARGRKKKKI